MKEEARGEVFLRYMYFSQSGIFTFQVCLYIIIIHYSQSA